MSNSEDDNDLCPPFDYSRVNNYISKDDTVMIQQQPPSEDLIVNPVTNPELEIFECVKCSHPNVLKKTQRRRRQTRIRHFRLDDVTYSSFVRYCKINCVDRNYGLLLLLMHAKTQNIDYILNPAAVTTAALINKKGRKKKKKTNKPAL